jgi:hypothetical protein
MVARRRARPRSATIITGRRRSRSTHTPATSPRQTTGTIEAAERSPIAVGPAPRTSRAARGRALPEMPEPSLETVCPTHSLRKSG